MAEVLNLNNEVVKMRKEIKRARALIIRKLIRQIANLKKKKGKEAEVEKNQRRAARLLEEIHAMKDLTPDHVTKTALMKNLSFEKVCKNPKSTMSERATARIATHPQISKRIQEIKAAVKAFKDERKKPAEVKASKSHKPAEDPKKQDKSDDSGEGEVEEEEEEEEEEEGNDSDDGCGDDDVEDKGEEEGFGVPKDSFSPTKEGPAVKTDEDVTVAASENELKGSSEAGEAQPQEKTQTPIKQQKSRHTAHKPKNSKTPHTKDKRIQKPAETKPPPQSQPNSRLETKSTRAKVEEQEEESDLDSSDDDEEKEYFDDSTEERFRKQSSQSEGSDEEDDFFLGKVSKFKKRKAGPSVGEERGEGSRNISQESALKGEAEGTCAGEGPGLQDLKPVKMESVFCTTLSGSKRTPGNHMRSSGPISKQQRFQKERRGPARIQKPAPFQNRGGGQDRKPMSKFQNRKQGDLGRGSQVQDRGPAAAKARPQFEKPRNHRAAGGWASNPSQHAQQALHPSWEASKRRKEQQAQITAFQGKKIKFDDD